MVKERSSDTGTLSLLAQLSETRAARHAEKLSDYVRRLEEHLTPRAEPAEAV